MMTCTVPLTTPSSGSKELKSNALENIGENMFQVKAAIGKMPYHSRLNVLRFLSMCSIVWGHALNGLDELHVHNAFLHLVQLILVQLGRIGTINFFIISGFLLSNKLQGFTVSGYLQYRFKTIILPWFIFLTMFVFMEVFKQGHKTPNINMAGMLLLTFQFYKAFIFHAAFWFIPVSVLSAMVIIACKNVVNKWWFGAILLCITLFYGINLYKGWVEVLHTKTAFTYVFFMWLGVQFATRQQYVMPFIEKISARGGMLLIIIFSLLALFEAFLLFRLHTEDPFASNRLSNCALSVIIFLTFLKKDTGKWVHALKPQHYIYGIYLVHCIVITQLLPLFDQWAISFSLNALPLYIIIHFLFFLTVMLFSYSIVFALRHSWLRLMVGDISVREKVAKNYSMQLAHG